MLHGSMHRFGAGGYRFRGMILPYTGQKIRAYIAKTALNVRYLH